MKYSSLFKILLTVILIVVLLLKINVSEIVGVFKSINYFFMIPVLILVPVLYVIRSMRWKILLDSVEIKISLKHALDLILIGSFYGLITPGKIGEFGRIFYLDEKKTISVATVMMEKTMDIAVLIVLSLITVFIFFRGISILLILIIGCGLLGVCGLYLISHESFLIKIGGVFHFDTASIKQYLDFSKKMIRNYSLMKYSIALTILYYFIAYIIGALIAIASGFKFLTVISLPIIVLIGNIPLTISGIGIRESIGSMMFVFLGQSAADGFVYALFIFILITVIPGVYGYILTMKR